MKSTTLIVPYSNINSIVILFHSFSSSLINTINVLLNKSESSQKVYSLHRSLIFSTKIITQSCEILKDKCRPQKNAS